MMDSVQSRSVKWNSISEKTMKQNPSVMIVSYELISIPPRAFPSVPVVIPLYNLRRCDASLEILNDGARILDGRQNVDQSAKIHQMAGQVVL